jgi:lycopene cyclase domain-containing protein
MLMAACLVVTVPLELVLGARVYRRLSSLVFAVIPVVVVFSIWDVIGIVRHHWTYNPRFVSGIRLPFSMPLEELVFFVVIPICGLLTYEAVGQVMVRIRAYRSARRPTHRRVDA